MIRPRTLVLLAAFTVGCATAAPSVSTNRPEARILTPASPQGSGLTWTKAPASFPAGAEIALIEGDSTKPGPYTLRLKFPEGYQLPPHSHPNDEHLTVIQGTFYLGLGDSFDRSKAIPLSAGSFSLLNNGVRHYAYVSGETIVQLHGVGPGGLIYVNPADDPRNK